MRLGAALGTALKRGARVVASRESAPAYRMIKRALISGLNSTGVDVADLRTLPAPVGRHLLKTQGYDAAFHVGAATTRPGGGPDPPLRAAGRRALGGAAEGDREALHAPGAAPRRRSARSARSRTRRAPARATRPTSCSELDAEAIRERGFRIVVDYGYSAACYVLPLVLGPLGVEAVDVAPVRVGLRRGAGATSTTIGAGAPPRRAPSAPTWGRSSTARPSACT